MSIDLDLFVSVLSNGKFHSNLDNAGWRSPDSAWSEVATCMGLENSEAIRKNLYNRWKRNWQGVRDQLLTKADISPKPVNQ